ncbi:MAG: hypothetical protein K6E19_06945 [Lachnospiraceae bacterium]|nr:hypothetical protein [Lachnospiraceae bacterium]
MSKTHLKPGIFSKKRHTPVHNLRSESFEVKPKQEDLSWAAEQLRQCEILMEIEDMENDRVSACIFSDCSVL